MLFESSVTAPFRASNLHRVAGRRERASNLEDELGIGITLCVERQRPGQSSRRGKAVDTCRESHPAQILPREHRVAGQPRQRVVCSRDIGLCLLCNGVVDMGITDHLSGREAGDCSTRAHSEITLEDGRTSIGDGGSAEYAEAFCRTE
jgi:hypothetical protein